MPKTATSPADFSRTSSSPRSIHPKPPTSFALSPRRASNRRNKSTQSSRRAPNHPEGRRDHLQTAETAGSELSLKTIAALRANAELNFSHLEALVGVKSVSELIEVQTVFFRKSVEAGVAQAEGPPGRRQQGRRGSTSR